MGNSASRTGGAAKQQKQATKASYSSNGAAASPSQKKHQVKTGGQRTKPETQKNHTADAVKAAAARRPSTSGSRAASVPERGTRKARETPQAAFVGKGDDEGEAFLSGSSFVLYEYYSYSYTASESGSSLDGAEPEFRQRNAGDGKAVVPETERHTRHRLHKGPSSGGPAEKQRGGRPPRSALHSPDVSNELKERQNKVHSVRSDSSSLLALSAAQQRPRLAGSSGGALPAGPQTSSLQATEEGPRTKPSTTPFSKDSRSGKSSSPLEMANRLRSPRESSSPPHQTRSPSHVDEKPPRKSLREERQTESEANKEIAGNAKRRKQRHRSTPTLEFALPRAARHSSDVSPVPDESEDSDPHPLESTIPACEEDVQRLREAIMDHTTSNHGDDGMFLSDRCHPLNGTGEWPLRTVDGNTGESAEPTRLRADAVAEPRLTEGRWPPEQQELWLGESLRTPTEQGKGRRRVRGDREPPSAHVFELPTLGDDRLASSTQRGAAAVVPSEVLCSSSQEPSPPFNSSSRNETKWWNQLHTDNEGGQGGHPAKQRRSDSSELEKKIADEVKQAEGEKQVCKKGGKTVVPQKNRKEVTTPTAGMTGPPGPQPFTSNGPPLAKPVSINTHVASPTLLIAMGTTPRAVQSPSSGGVLLDGTAISLVPTGDTQSNEKPLAQFEMLPLTSMTSSNEAQLWGLPQDTQPAEVLLLPETLSFSIPAPAMENHFVKGGGLRGGDDDDDGDWIDVRSPSSPLWLTPFAYSSTPPTSTLSEAKWHLSPDRHPHRLHVQHLQKRCRSAVSDSSQARRQKPTEEGGSAAPKAPLAGGVWSPTLANGSADSGRSAVWTPVDALGSDEETAMTGVGLTAGMGPPYGGTSRRVAEQGRKFRLKAKSDRERSLMLRLGRKKIPHGPVRSALMLDPMLSATSTPLTMVLPSSSFVSRGDLARKIVQCKKKQPVQESLERQTPGSVRRRQSSNGAAEDAMDVQEVMDEEEEEEEEGEELLAQGREDDRSPTTVSTRLQEEHLGHEQGGGTPPAGAATANARPDAVSYSLGALTHTPALLAMRRRAFTLRRKRPKHIRDSWFARLQQPELSMTSFFDDGRVTPQKSKSLKAAAATTSQVGHTNDVRTERRWCAEEEEELGVGVSASWSHVSASPPRRGEEEEEDGVVEDSNVKEMLQRTESVTHTRAFLSHPREPSNVSSLYPHSGLSVPPSSTRPTAENCLSTPHSTAGEAVNHPSVDSQGTAQRPRDPRSGAHAALETSRNPSRHSSDIMSFCFSLLCSGEVTQRELIREAEAELFGELKVSFAYFRGHVAGLRRSPSPGQSSIVPLHWESRVSTSGGPSPLLLDNCTALALPGFGSETRSGMLPTTSTFTPSVTTATLLHRSNTVAAAGGPPTFTETGLQRRPLPSWQPLTDTAETDEALQHAATAAPATSSPVKGDRSVGRQNSSPGTTNAPQEGDLEPKPTPPISNAAAEGGATTGKKEEVELERRQDEPAVQWKGGAEATAPFPLRRRSPSIPEETRSVSVTAKPDGTAANRPTEGSQAIELHSVPYRAPSPISPRSPSNEPLSSPRHLPLSPRVDSFPSSALMELLEHQAVLRGASSEVGGVGERTPPNSGSEHPLLTNEVPAVPITREAAPTAVRDSEVKPAADGRPPIAHQRREEKTTPAEDTPASPLEQLDLETLLKQYQKLQQNFATKRSASVSPLSLALEQPAHSPLKQEIMDSHTTTASSGVNPPPDSLLFMDVSPPSSTSSFGLLERRSGVGESEAGSAAAGKGDPSKLPPLHFSTPHEVERPPAAAARATHTEDVTERILTLEERQTTRFRSESTSSVKPTPIGGRTTTPQESAAREGMSSASRPHASSSPLTIRRGVSEDEHAMIPPQSPSPSPSRSNSCLSSSSGDVKGHPAASEEGLVRGSIFRSLYGPTQLGEAPDNLLPQPTIPEDKSAERQTKRRDHHGLEHQPAHHHRHHKKIKSTMAEQRSLVSPSLSMADESAETPSPLASSATTAPQSAERLPSRFSSDRVPYRVSLPSPASSSLEVAPPTAVKRSSPSPHRVVGLSSFTRGSSQSPLLGTALSFSPSGERAASVESPLHTDAAWTRSSASPSLPREDAVPGVYVAPSMSTLRSALSPPHADLRSHRAVSAVRGTTPASLPAPLRGSTEVPATRVTQRYVSPSPAPPTSRGTLLLEKVLQDEEELKQIRFTAASSPGRASRPLLLSPPMDVPPFTAAPAPSVSTSRGDHLTRPPHTHRTSLEKPPTEKTGGGHRTFGKYLCQYCGQLYGSSERCTVASAFTHRALRRRRRTQKEVKKAAQALLREGRVREAVELLQRYEIVVPSSFTGRGSRSVSRSAEAGGGAREGERARRHSQRLTLTPLTLERERERYRREAEEEERQGRASLPPPPSSSRPAQSPSEDRNRTTRMRTSTSPQSVLLYSNNRRVLDGPPLPLPPSHRS